MALSSPGTVAGSALTVAVAGVVQLIVFFVDHRAIVYIRDLESFGLVHIAFVVEDVNRPQLMRTRGTLAFLLFFEGIFRLWFFKNFILRFLYFLKIYFQFFLNFILCPFDFFELFEF